jgi:predicted N-acyltransferase
MTRASEKLDIRRADSLAATTAAQWDRLLSHDFPFFRHAFLAGLEQFDCLKPHGWYPHHLLAYRRGTLVGALPLYLKTNSWGEFVFDYAWADAYERGGRSYYPKLVCAVPFAPVTGPRVLVAADEPAPDNVRDSLIQAAISETHDLGLSSLHFLFADDADVECMRGHDLLIRSGCQYHWHNENYNDFDDFLDRLNSKHRKQIRRERRSIAESDVVIDVLDGHSADHRAWEAFHGFYRSTFHRKWGDPRFSLDFLEHLGEKLADETLLLLARRGDRYIAGAFGLRGKKRLFGRHWGCSEFHRNLHFELCYYKTIDYCIEYGLQTLDAGAQGEHKVSRGFVPQNTWSAHWLRDPDFALAVEDFLRRETVMIDRHMRSLNEHLPYKHSLSA